MTPQLRKRVQAFRQALELAVGDRKDCCGPGTTAHYSCR